MKLSKSARELCDEITMLPVVDAHEHLPPESDYIGHGYSGVNLFSNYLRFDLLSAGMPAADMARVVCNRQTGFTGDKSVDSWWPLIRPYWEQVRYTGYGKALRIAARDLFGIAEIDDRTIHDLAARVKADNAPGLYRRILREKCRIRAVVDHDFAGRVSFPDDPLLRGLSIHMLTLLNPMKTASMDEAARRSGMKIRTLDDLTAAMQNLIRNDIRNGAVGLKMVCMDFPETSAQEAQAEFHQARAKSEPEREFPALARYLADRCLDVAAEADVPVAVHSGVWGDFRKLDPKFMLTFGCRRPEVRFDLFHLGMPMVHDAAMIGKNLPNVTLNLCWCPIVSQSLTAKMLDELLDLAPINKIIAFGGDYYCAVHKVYGHLVMTREAVASVLARRVEAGDFDRAEALRIASMWLHDNPARIYRV